MCDMPADTGSGRESEATVITGMFYRRHGKGKVVRSTFRMRGFH